MVYRFFVVSRQPIEFIFHDRFEFIQMFTVFGHVCRKNQAEIEKLLFYFVDLSKERSLI